MGRTAKEIKEIQTRRAAYHERKTREEKNRIASYMSEEDRYILFSGNGFVRVPETERAIQRIDVYPYLIE